MIAWHLSIGEAYFRYLEETVIRFGSGTYPAPTSLIKREHKVCKLTTRIQLNSCWALIKRGMEDVDQIHFIGQNRWNTKTWTLLAKRTTTILKEFNLVMSHSYLL